MVSLIVSYIPDRWQIVLKQIVYFWKIKIGHFITSEPEFNYVTSILHAGDSVIDIGANIGVYTFRFSQLVGQSGHVYAFEPIPESFYLLTAHTSLCQHRNVTLLNIAASDKVMMAQMKIPRSSNQLRNYYRASIAESGVSSTDQDSIQVFCYPIDLLQIPEHIRLVKIDVEGHEAFVLKGMSLLLRRDKPILIIETVSPEICEWLKSQGYRQTYLQDSPNTIFEFANT